LSLFDFFNQQQPKEKRSAILRGPFRYAGSKAKALPYILPHIPYRNSYIEVFGGTGCVLLNREPSNVEVFNDRNSGITCFYRCLRDKDKLEKLKELVDLTPWGREDYYFSKEHWQNQNDELMRAYMWYVSVQFSFGGVGRTFGRPIEKKSAHPRDKFSDWLQVHDRISRGNVLIENLDWRQAIQDFDNKDAVFYCDPAYMETTSSPAVNESRKRPHVQIPGLLSC